MINDEVKGKNNNKYLDIDKTAFRGLFLSSCSLAGSDVFWPEVRTLAGSDVF